MNNSKGPLSSVQKRRIQSYSDSLLPNDHEQEMLLDSVEEILENNPSSQQLDWACKLLEEYREIRSMALV